MIKGAPWVGFPKCPCGCAAEGLKLYTKPANRDGLLHVHGCRCPEHIGLRSQRKGKAAQRRMHQRLGGTGFTPSNEESARPYTIEVTVMPECKAGAQVPASWAKFIGTEWFRRALGQSERAVPAGTHVVPALVIAGRWLIADLRTKRGEHA